MTTAADPVAEYLAIRVSVQTQFCTKSTEHAYSCLEDFVLRHGQGWTPGPRPKGVRMGTRQRCFANTYKLVSSVRGQQLGLRYVEGYAAGVIPVLHAWAVTPDGAVIDPTWSATTGQLYYGVPFPLPLVEAAILLSGYWSVLDDWHNNYPLLRAPYDPETTTERLRDEIRAKADRRPD